MRAFAVLIIALLVLPGAALATNAGGADLLVELDRARGQQAVPALRLSGGRLVSHRLGLWLVPSQPAARILPGLERARLVRAVEPDHRYRRLGHLAAGDPLLSSQWWIAAIGADQVEPPGPGKPVTILDSGLDITHPEFAGRPDTTLLNA